MQGAQVLLCGAVQQRFSVLLCVPLAGGVLTNYDNVHHTSSSYHTLYAAMLSILMVLCCSSAFAHESRHIVTHFKSMFN